MNNRTISSRCSYRRYFALAWVSQQTTHLAAAPSIITNADSACHLPCPQLHDFLGMATSPHLVNLVRIFCQQEIMYIA